MIPQRAVTNLIIEPNGNLLRTLLNSYSLLAITACLLWSSAFVGIKVGLQYTTPLQFAGIRFMISGLLLLPFCSNIFRLIESVRKNSVTVIYVTLFQTILLYTLFYTGVELLPASVAAMIIGSQPLMIAIMAHYWTDDDKLSVKKTGAIILGVLGVVLVSLSRGPFSMGGGAEMLGILLLLASNTCAGIGNMMVAKTKTTMPFLELNCVQLFLGGVVMLLISLPIEGFTWQAKELPYFYSLAWLSFLSAAALSIWFHLLQSNVAVSDLNVWKFLIPVAGACLSWVLLETESPDLYSVTGMILIVLALIFLNIRGK